MSTYTQIYYHLIFSTYERQPHLLKENRSDLFHYIWGLLKNKNCALYQINGMEDHLHLLVSLHPSLSLSQLVKDIKISSSLWIKENNKFPLFQKWQEGYGAFTVSHAEKEKIIRYIKNQEEHHHRMTFREEYLQFLQEANVEYNNRYL